MTPTRVTVSVYAALALNVIYAVLAIGLSDVRTTALSSNLTDALRQDGYEVPSSLIYEMLKASQAFPNQLVYLLIVPSTAFLLFCVVYLNSKSSIGHCEKVADRP